jgi:hypothetical protein
MKYLRKVESYLSRFIKLYCLVSLVRSTNAQPSQRLICPLIPYQSIFVADASNPDPSNGLQIMLASNTSQCVDLTQYFVNPVIQVLTEVQEGKLFNGTTFNTSQSVDWETVWYDIEIPCRDNNTTAYGLVVLTTPESEVDFITNVSLQIKWAAEDYKSQICDQTPWNSIIAAGAGFGALLLVGICVGARLAKEEQIQQERRRRRTSRPHLNRYSPTPSLTLIHIPAQTRDRQVTQTASLPRQG